MKVRILFTFLIIIIQLGVLFSHSISSDLLKTIDSNAVQTSTISADTHSNECGTPIHDTKDQQHNCHFGHCYLLKPSVIGILDPLLILDTNPLYISHIHLNNLISAIERPPKA